ncbi:ABC transporter ATP-binding protein, partial [Vibrio parahaemolyticus]|nr:ABC transporter ATP-binding protein [Vibrio parahaemolyticus]MDG2685510.1 ABC transporter ATP-binding protein [Vibrio parahaemolyticus]
MNTFPTIIFNKKLNCNYYHLNFCFGILLTFVSKDSKTSANLFAVTKVVVMFNWFEKLTQPFPQMETEKPPKTLFGFCRFYTRGFEAPLLVMAIFSALIAVTEVTL